MRKGQGTLEVEEREKMGKVFTGSSRIAPDLSSTINQSSNFKV